MAGDRLGFCRTWAFGVAAIFGSVPALAALSPFTICDLHTAPNDKSDGREAPDFRARNTVKTIPAADRVAACGQALAAPELEPAFWARRIDLLGARTILELSLGKRTEALADIEEARRIGAPRNGDRFYERSALLGVRMLHAAALLDGTTGAAPATYSRRPSRPASSTT